MSIDYERLMAEGLRLVVRRALQQVGRQGLPGAHHFYIAFRTRDPGVVVPARLAAAYPEVMTIVLQHQFEDLEVSEEGFRVGLRFSGVLSTIEVPFASIVSFSDPSVPVQLQFPEPEALAEDEAPDGDEAPLPSPLPSPLLSVEDTFAAPEGEPGSGQESGSGDPEQEVASDGKLPARGKKGARGSGPGTPEPNPPAPEAGRIISMENFRKKQGR